jgi:hypothetical protein
MPRTTTHAARRPFATRWSVILFVVIGSAVGIAIMLWQLSGDAPDEPDSSSAPYGSALGWIRT